MSPMRRPVWAKHDSNGNCQESFFWGPHVELGDKTVAEVQQNVANWYQ